MRKADSTQQYRQQLSRRRYVQALAGASLAGLAGCTTGDGGTDGDASTIRVHVDNVPEQSNLNPWAANERNAGEEWLTELMIGDSLEQSAPLLDGHTFDATWIDDRDEISVPTIVTDYEIDEPHDVYEEFNEDLTYWDGTPIDAEARVAHARLQWHSEGHQFDDAETFNHEAVDQWTHHWWSDKGEVEGQSENPLPSHVLEDQMRVDFETPMHPDFTEPYVEAYEDAETEDEDDAVTDDLSGDTITFERLAEEEWGSGLYRLDPDRIGQDTMVATRRDDHPNEHAVIEEIEMQLADYDRLSILAQQGEIDVQGGILPESGGDINRESAPDYIQEIDRYLEVGADQMLFNMNNEHLQNLWVRRAIIAAVDWDAVGTNGWGDERSVPAEHHVGLSDALAEEAFDEAFLDSLYTYPIESDTDLAAEWMERAGYTREDDTWTSPDGEEVQLPMEVNTDITDYVGASDTVQSYLEEFGFVIDYQGMDQMSQVGRMEPGEDASYGMMIFWAGDDEPWKVYYTDGSEWGVPLVNGDPEAGNPYEVDREEYSETDNHGRPLDAVLPSEVGSIEAPDEAGRVPDLEDGVEVSLPELIHSLRDPDISDGEYQEALELCARYVNYYVPAFMFHGYPWGMWGNVRDFAFPEEGHEANRVWNDFSGEDYAVLSGVVQDNSDGEYSEP